MSEWNKERAGGSRTAGTDACAPNMSTTAKQFHEEEAIGKTYDFQVARRLARYLKPYIRLLIPALMLTLLLNLFGILQPLFTWYAIDYYILPKKTDGLVLFALIFRDGRFIRLGAA